MYGHIGPCCLPVVADENDWFRFPVDSGDEIFVGFETSPPTRARLLGPGDAVLDVEGYYPDRLAGTAGSSGTAYIHLTQPPGGANSEYGFTLEINGNSGDDRDGGTGGGNEGSERLFEIEALEEGPVRYELTVDGTIRKATVNEDITAEENDRILECSDGRQLVVGYTGNPGKGDAFIITGPVVSFVPYATEADFVVRIDGEEVSYGDDGASSLQ